MSYEKELKTLLACYQETDLEAFRKLIREHDLFQQEEDQRTTYSYIITQNSNGDNNNGKQK